MAKAVTEATKKGANGAKAGRARRIDPTHARRVLFETARDMTYAQVRERLDSDREFMRMAWAVPEVRAKYHELMKAKTGK